MKLASSLSEKVTIMVSLLPKHAPLFVLFKTKRIELKFVSVGLIIYVAFKVLAFGTNVPVPVVLQTPVVVLPVTEPFNCMLGVILQIG